MAYKCSICGSNYLLSLISNKKLVCRDCTTRKKPNLDKHEELKKAVISVSKFLDKYYDPHAYVIISAGKAEIVVGDMAIVLQDPEETE